MTDNIQDITQPILQSIQETVLATKNEIRHGFTLIGDRLDRIEFRLGAVEQHMGLMVASSASDRDEVTQLTKRVERIEHQLNLVNGATP
jgi:tetrahydromethanopterin S-methyltransferase subunit G